MTYSATDPTRSVLYRLLRERYSPTPMPRWAGPVWSLLLVAAGLVIAADLVRVSRTPGRLPEQLAWVDWIGVEAWGWIIAATSLAVVAAFLSRSLAAVILTHMLACAAWFTLGFAYVQGQAFAHTWDGTRIALLLVGGAVMWGIRTVILARDFYRPGEPVELRG